MVHELVTNAFAGVLGREACLHSESRAYDQDMGWHCIHDEEQDKGWVMRRTWDQYSCSITFAHRMERVTAASCSE